MDYLPIQATSVPCERVFSSAKDTDTAKRNRVNPALMESLQMLKYSLKKERLDFMNGWGTPLAVMGEVPIRAETDLGAAVPNRRNAELDALLEDIIKYES